MTKRTFVLFFCLAQLLASSLFSQRSVASCRLESGTNGFSPYSVETSKDFCDFVISDETIEEDEETIVRSDDHSGIYELRENLTNLLRHRQTSYRFVTYFAEVSPEYKITQIRNIVRPSAPLLPIAKGALILPGYYGFLHRLCPF